ncbi:unnamed protein product [Discosporangium mesarthrocarpum]
MLYKVVTCPVEGCGYVSTTFDPFMYLTVPLPAAAEVSLEVPVIWEDGSTPTIYRVSSGRNKQIKDLLMQLSIQCGVAAERLLLGQVSYQCHSIMKFFMDEAEVASISPHDINMTLAYELHQWPSPPVTNHPADQATRQDTDVRRTETGEAEKDWGALMSPFMERCSGEQRLREALDSAVVRSQFLQDADQVLRGFDASEDVLWGESKLQSGETLAGEDLARAEKAVEEVAYNPNSSRIKFNSCTFFKDINNLDMLVRFRKAVSSLRENVLQEQQDFVVQVVQKKRNNVARAYSGTRNTGSYWPSRSYVSFSTPLVLSYQPHQTTVGDFKKTLAARLRSHLRPLSSTWQVEDRGIVTDSNLEGDVGYAMDTRHDDTERDWRHIIVGGAGREGVDPNLGATHCGLTTH